VPESPPVGGMVRLGDLRIQVLGPLRRYAGPNDQSIVLLVDAGGPTLLLPGDVEKVAQAELGPISADVIKVPHQGAGTTDLSWLKASVGLGAVITVGPNTYGHPAPEVVELLTARVPLARTDRDGDVLIPLEGDPVRFFPKAAGALSPRAVEPGRSSGNALTPRPVRPLLPGR
jgi:beta-lactamase superfamily II metal-dependent hydrolase